MITSKIEKIKEKLNRRLKFIRQCHDIDFCLEVKEYLNLLEQDSLLSGLIESLKIEGTKMEEEVVGIEKEAEKELNNIKNEIELQIKNNNINVRDQQLFNLFQEYEQYANKTKIPLGESPIYSQQEQIIEIIKHLRDTYPQVDLNKYLVLDSSGNPLRYNLSTAVNEYTKKKRKCELEKRTNAASAYVKLDYIRWALNLYLKELDNVEETRAILEVASKQFFINQIIKAIENGNSEFFKNKEFFQSLLRLHNFILDNLELQHLGFSLVNRFKQRVEWYQKNEYSEICKKKENKSKKEVELTKRLSNFLFDMGVFPVSQAIFGNKKPDVIALHPSEIIILEAKVFERTDNSYLSQGLNQIYNYMNTLGQYYGHLILFNRTNQSIDIEDHFSLKDKTIFINTINLNEAPSKSKMKVWNVPKLEHLVKL